MEEIKTTYQGFAEIARIIREGKLGQLHIGDTISTRHTLRDRLLWRIIGINADAALDGTPETVTVMLCNPPIWCSFDGGRKGFPYGCNEWEPSDVRARLQGDVLDDFDAEDRAVIVPVRKATYSPQNERIRHTSDKLFLLSASEIGIAVDDDAIHDEGNAYALIVPDKLGAPVRLDILDPTKVRPQRHPETGEMWYYITLDDGNSYPLPGCQLIVVRHMSANGEIGIRPIDVLRGTLDYDKQVKELSLAQLDGVNHGVFLTVPNTGLGEEERNQVIDSFLDAYERSGQRVVILEGGLTATTFSQNAIDAQVLDVERITRNRVATVYNIPPHLLGDYSDTSFSTAEQQMQEFLQLTIMPIVAQWEQELNRKLLTPADFRAGYRFRFDVDALARADTATMAEKFQKAIRGGWMRPNEVRLREGLPPDDNGGELMASRDLLPLRIAIKNPELLLAAKTNPSEGGGNNP